ncbi:MAG: Fic family protein [Reyranella sp.]|uniref:Fic family protein n=1 Tax=Reyranella sp. TaxID=1929291 RepID=UPI001AC259DC|nr:Fic family protein [Reyranella sp.]MBN9419634.1 Fic family protein [Candidatus Eremiobacteraeota bacterium]MBN9535226.1 Fic family protein [Alphaproteobacteria bacterium]MBR2817222.1 Fic family protein [Reyranella sp.]
MENLPKDRFSGPVAIFQTRRLPETATPAGYAALIDAFGLDLPLPRRLAAIGVRHRVYEKDGWQVLTPRHAPSADLAGHLTFALKYEGLDLLILKRLFHVVGANAIEAIVRAAPTGSYARRLWFLYEWLLGRTLDLPTAPPSAYVPVVDPQQHYAGRGVTSTRHRVRNNLPGTPSFCPLVAVTPALEAFRQRDLAAEARRIVANVPADLMARAAAFLLLKDSKSSFAIEGEHPSQDRIRRWGQAIAEAGRRPIDVDELDRLQRIIIGDARFVRLGLRQEGGFVGEHDRDTRMALPDHISARHEDLPDLIRGLIAFDRTAAETLDPVIAAAVLAFGFVYVHPFEDGNGRLHRYLIHHVLAERGFNPPGIVFPVSAAILDRMKDYRDTLESYSGRLLPSIRWEPTATGNVKVLNDTADFYRFFDATPHAQFLYECVDRTIEVDLPAETRFLGAYDGFRRAVSEIVDMPDRTVGLLLQFLRQNNGVLSKRATDNEFAALTAPEIERIERAFADHFSEAVA